MNDDSPPLREPRYPVWLGVASFAWVVLGWILAALAPALAFVPSIEVLHRVMPGVTVLLILTNLAFSLKALFRLKVRIDQLFLVTGLQFGLFTTLFFQISSHFGAENYWIHQPTKSWEWVGFSVAHALRASDVLDTIEAFGWNVQVIKHRSLFVASVVVAYHVVIDLFVLGLFWALMERIKKRFMEHPERASTIRAWGIVAFLIWVCAWLLCALWLRPWRPLDMPLWLGENVVRVVDFADVMESFDIHWHQVPRELPESTLTFFCRFWIAVALSLLVGWQTARGKVRPLVAQEEPPSLQRFARLGIAAILIAVLIGADWLVQVGNVERITELTTSACGDDPERVDRALAAIRRLGPHAQDAIDPLAETLARSPDRQVKILETLGHLGPNAVHPLRVVALRGNLPEAEVAVVSLRQIGPMTAPILAAVWEQTRWEEVKAATVAELRVFGLAAMPFLMDATDTTNSAVHLHWFNELDRNWILRGTDNRTVLALKKWQETNPLEKYGKDKDWIRESGTAAIPRLVQALADKEEVIRLIAVEGLGHIGLGAKEVVPSLVKVLADREWVVRDASPHVLPFTIPFSKQPSASREWIVPHAAVEALGHIGPSAREASPDLLKAMVDPEENVRKAAARALKQIGMNDREAIPDLIKYMVHPNVKVREVATRSLKEMKPTRQELEKVRSRVPDLIQALADKDNSVIVKAYDALRMVDPGWSKSDLVRQAIPELINKALSDKERNVREDAVKVLRMFEPSVRGNVPELVKALTDKDIKVRIYAAEAWGTLDRTWNQSDNARQLIPDLIAALTGKESDVRIGAANVLGQIGSKAQVAVPDLVKVLMDDNAQLRKAAIVALGGIGPGAVQAVPQLVKALVDKEDTIRRDAIDVLGKIGPGAREAVPELVTFLKDKNMIVRASTATALGRIGPGSREAVPALVKALVDNDEYVRKTVDDALRKIDPKWHELEKSREAIPILVDALMDNKEQVRQAAAEALGNMGPLARETVPDLIKTLEDKEEKVRKASADALKQIGPGVKEAVPNLVVFLMHKNENVRKAAAVALGQIGPDAREALSALAKLAASDDDFFVMLAAKKAIQQIRGK